MLPHFVSKPTPFFARRPSPAGSRQLCRAGSRFTLDAVAPQDRWDMNLVSGPTPAPGERSWKTVSLSIRILSRSKPVQQGRCRSRSPLGAAQKRGHDVHAASPSTGSLILAFLGQQSCLSLALAVVLQPHCTAYPFLKSTPHKYFVKHLLANVLVLIIFFSSLAVWKGCSLSHPSLVCGSCRYLVHVCCFEVTRALPSTLKVSSVRCSVLSLVVGHREG